MPNGHGKGKGANGADAGALANLNRLPEFTRAEKAALVKGDTYVIERIKKEREGVLDALKRNFTHPEQREAVRIKVADFLSRAYSVDEEDIQRVIRVIGAEEAGTAFRTVLTRKFGVGDDHLVRMDTGAVLEVSHDPIIYDQAYKMYAVRYRMTGHPAGFKSGAVSFFVFHIGDGMSEG